MVWGKVGERFREWFRECFGKRYGEWFREWLGNGLGKALGNGLRNGLGSGLGKGSRNSLGKGSGIGFRNGHLDPRSRSKHLFDDFILQHLMTSFCMDLNDMHFLLWILKS